MSFYGARSQRPPFEVLLITPDDLLQKVKRDAEDVMPKEGFGGHRIYTDRGT